MEIQRFDFVLRKELCLLLLKSAFLFSTSTMVLSVARVVNYRRMNFSLSSWNMFHTLQYMPVFRTITIHPLKKKIFLGIEAPPRDYSIEGTTTSRIFSTIGASANLVFAFNTGMLPEIQATIRRPVVGNMMKALYFQFTVGVLPMYAVTFIGYWAYGKSTSVYLMNSVNGPAWAKAFANFSALLQTVVALHIFASPMYEYLDTKFGIEGSALAAKNLSFRIVVRGGYVGLTTFISALLPFLGDFMSLTGAISTFPLTFILANHMYLVAKNSKLTSLQKSWHWFNAWFFGCASIAAAVAALRLIYVDSKTYHTFADL